MNASTSFLGLVQRAASAESRTSTIPMAAETIRRCVAGRESRSLGGGCCVEASRLEFRTGRRRVQQRPGLRAGTTPAWGLTRSNRRQPPRRPRCPVPRCLISFSPSCWCECSTSAPPTSAPDPSTSHLRSMERHGLFCPLFCTLRHPFFVGIGGIGRLWLEVASGIRTER